MCVVAVAADEIRFDFENDAEGWGIPEWALEQRDHVGHAIALSEERASSGKKSLKVDAKFPADVWTAVVIELEKDMNLNGYHQISFDVYIPEEAKSARFQAKVIMTVGEYQFIETRDPVTLSLGRWQTIVGKFDMNKDSELKFWFCKTNEKCVMSQLNKREEGSHTDRARC